jgi:Ca2+/Na+ antiporter
MFGRYWYIALQIWGIFVFLLGIVGGCWAGASHQNNYAVGHIVFGSIVALICMPLGIWMLIRGIRLERRLDDDV